MFSEYLFSPGIFVHIALVFYALGFLFRDELYLRSLILAGTVFYLLYYYYAAEQPLWDALFASTILFAINLALILVIIRERTTFALSPDETALYGAFSTLSPGQFRKISKIAKWHQHNHPVTITREGEAQEKLYYIMPGEVTISKLNSHFTAQGDMFIGEIAFMLSSPATATVEVSPGTKYIEWDSGHLKKMMHKSQSLDNALRAMFNFDLARKVTESIGNISVRQSL